MILRQQIPLVRSGSRLFHKIAISSDEKCFIAYHPDVDHPYEHTKPVPKESKASDSVLKVDSRHMITKSPNLDQIQALTYTPRRYWLDFVGKRKREAYKKYFDDNVDRKGLTS